MAKLKFAIVFNELRQLVSDIDRYLMTLMSQRKFMSNRDFGV